MARSREMTPRSLEELLDEAEKSLRLREIGRALAAFALAEAVEKTDAERDRLDGGRWLAAMLTGDFRQAWQQSDAIRNRNRPDPHRLWLGDPIDGRRVMLRCLHGFGDAVQMLRFMPLLQARAAKVTVEVAPHFVELASCFDGVDEVITWGDRAPVAQPSWDVQVEIMELPYLFRTQLEELPLRTRYLYLPCADDLEHKLGPGLRVGLVWTAGSWNPARSVPFDLLRPLLQIPGCDLWSLQGGGPHEQAANLQTDLLCQGSLLRLAQMIAAMDLVITPDTLAAHLAGALGTPAWVMLQHTADWRWMLDREESAWYPSLRLFRQAEQDGWHNVLAAVQDELIAWAGRGERKLVR